MKQPDPVAEGGGVLHRFELHVSGKADQQAEARNSVKLSVLCSFCAFFDIFSVRSL